MSDGGRLKKKMLKMVIALAMVIASVQCAAACTPIQAAQPACHHHKQGPASCSHELIPATIVQPPAALEFQAEAMHIPVMFFADGLLHANPLSTPPPRMNIPPLTVLRV